MSTDLLRRTFQYHGAEHKTVYCHEAGQELTPDNARPFTTLHPRCGTAFLFLVMIISILVGSAADQVIYLLFGIEKMGFILRFGRSLLILPLITGISYEPWHIRYVGTTHSLIMRDEDLCLEEYLAKYAR